MLNAKGFNLLFLLLFLIDTVDCLNKQPVLYLLNICQIIVRHANVVSDYYFLLNCKRHYTDYNIKSFFHLIFFVYLYFLPVESGLNVPSKNCADLLFDMKVKRNVKNITARALIKSIGEQAQKLIHRKY